MNRVWKMTILITITLTVVSAAAAENGLLSSSEESTAARLKFDMEQAEFNRQIEAEKLKVERLKAWTSGASLMVPLLAAVLTLAFGVWNYNQQANQQREAQEKTAVSQFELRAAEIVLSEKGPVGARNKARALKALFPSKLPADFVASFDPRDFEGPKTESYEAKKVFFETAASHPGEIEALAALWQKLFPGDKWMERVTANATREMQRDET